MSDARYRTYATIITASAIAASVGIFMANTELHRLAFLAAHGIVTVALLMLVRCEPDDDSDKRKDGSS